MAPESRASRSLSRERFDHEGVALQRAALQAKCDRRYKSCSLEVVDTTLDVPAHAARLSIGFGPDVDIKSLDPARLSTRINGRDQEV